MATKEPVVKKTKRKRDGMPIYARIALDIANRIENGELLEGKRLSGRSLMSSEYGVSPETIRRAFSLLEEL
ncbi:MAG: GntR family transcriptional regulator, partial [Sphaerochaetaceae bacterium]|nr:GntR family transcriptional regulator [Sphaerochaetaceae bacterium]